MMMRFLTAFALVLTMMPLAAPAQEHQETVLQSGVTIDGALRARLSAELTLTDPLRGQIKTRDVVFLFLSVPEGRDPLAPRGALGPQLMVNDGMASLFNDDPKNLIWVAPLDRTSERAVLWDWQPQVSPGKSAAEDAERLAADFKRQAELAQSVERPGFDLKEAGLESRPLPVDNADFAEVMGKFRQRLEDRR